MIAGGVVGSDRLPQSQEEEEDERQFRPIYPAFFFSLHAVEHGMDGRCLYICVHVCVCVCWTALLHHCLWLCLVSSSPTAALLPCQRMMAYLLHIETGTGDSDTPHNGF